MPWMLGATSAKKESFAIFGSENAVHHVNVVELGLDLLQEGLHQEDRGPLIAQM